MNRGRSALALLALSLFGAQAPAQFAGKCLQYEPARVAVQGVLVRLTFPGPPNFESVANGDKPETGFYIRLSNPVCVDESASDPANSARRNVRLVQLVLDEGGYRELRPQLGRLTKVEGTISGAITGHHHAPVVMSVDGAK